METKMSNLKPCPFCGGEAVRADCVGCGYLQIRCSKCLAIVTVTLADRDSLAAIKKDEERLIANWNRRTEEVIRCKDCRAWDREKENGRGGCFCWNTDTFTGSQDFCSSGVRRDDEQKG